MDVVKLVCISDTHGDHDAVDLPAGDVLIHAGDITAHGTELDLLRFLDWFGSRDVEHRLFVAGNHDTFLEQHPERTARLAREAGVTWLNDSGCRAAGIEFWGSPITPRFLDWSFMREPGADIERHWARIPAETQVLITHGPPHGILDGVERLNGTSDKTGCPSLLTHLDRIRPAVHLFGHIHEGYGRVVRNGIEHLNISTMDREYRIANAPVIIAIEHHGDGRRDGKNEAVSGGSVRKNGMNQKGAEDS